MTKWEGLNAEQSQMYDLGRQAQAAGYQTRACNVRDTVKRAWWMAGWHDADLEAGNCVYFNEQRVMVVSTYQTTGV